MNPGRLPCRSTTAYNSGNHMKTISITIDEPLLGHLDRAARTARKTRSELFRQALQDWLNAQRRCRQVAEDRAGYEAHPVGPDEFEGLIAAQAVEPPAPEDGDDW